MKNIIKIIQTNGGLAGLKQKAMRIEVPGFDRLCIEYIGTGLTRGTSQISVAHYHEVNGDLCQSPDIAIQVPDVGWDTGTGWLPVYFQQAIPPIYQEVMVVQDGKVMLRKDLATDILSFMRTWDKNIGDQGFVLAALHALGKSRGVEIEELGNGRYATKSLISESRHANLPFTSVVDLLRSMPYMGRDA